MEHLAVMARQAQADSAVEYQRLLWVNPPRTNGEHMRARWYQYKHAKYSAEARALLFELIDGGK